MTDPSSGTLTIDSEALKEFLRPVIEEAITGAMAQLGTIITGTDVQVDAAALAEQATTNLVAAVAAPAHTEDTPPVDVDAPLPHTAAIDCWCQPTKNDSGGIRHHMTAPTTEQTNG